jgi:hypothetical protein
LKPELLVALIAVALSFAALVRLRGLVEGARGFAKKLTGFADELAALRKSVASQATKASELKGAAVEVGGPPARGDSEAVEIEALDRAMRGLASTVQVLEMRAQEHDALLCALVTEDEARHLWNLSRGLSMQYELLASTEIEMRSLVRRKLIAKKGEFKIHELESPFELTEHFALTDAGETLLELRKMLQSSDMAPATSLPPQSSEDSEE